MASASSINLFTSTEAADDPVQLAKLTAESIASLAAARIESGDMSADLVSQLQEISQQLAASESQNRLTEAELAARAKALEREAKMLADLRTDFEVSRDQWQASQKELIKSQKQWTSQVQQQDLLLQQRLDKLAACGLQFDETSTVSSDDPETALVLKSRISHQREVQLEAMLRDAEDRENELLQENRTLEEQIESLNHELEEVLGKGAERLMREDYTAMADQLQATQRDADRLRHELSHQDAQLEKIRAELETLRNTKAVASGTSSEASNDETIFASIQSLMGENENPTVLDEEALQQAWIEQAEAEKEALKQEFLEQAEAERNELFQRYQEKEASYQSALEEAAKRLEELEAQSGEPSGLDEQAALYREEAARLEEEAELLKRRYEMAMSDLKELKAENETLKQNLTQAAMPTASSSPSNEETNEPLNWEEEKRRLVAMLESDFHEDAATTPEQQAAIQEERMRIEDIIDQTDRIVQVKTQEITELRSTLQDQSSQVGNLSVGIGAFEEAFSHDDIILQERENLKRLQDELHEKLKKAEIGISLERAKVARERFEMDEMLNALGLNRDKIKEVVDEAKKKAATQKEEMHRSINPKVNKQVNWFDQMGLEEGD